MHKVDINSNVKIYYIISWVLGLAFLIPVIAGLGENAVLLLVSTSFMNLFFNGLVLIFLTVLLYAFPENRIQFLHSIILLLFNFPFVMFYCIIINLTISNL